MVYSPLAYGAAWIQFTCQIPHPGTGQCNKAPLVHMLLPGHFITKEIQAAAVCFVQTTVVATDVETGLVENLKKK